jgi:hypothetical protein
MMNNPIDPMFTMAASAANPLTIVLNGPSNWYDWFFLIKDTADNADVWEYIDPSREEPMAVPERPVLPALPEVLDAEGKSTWTVQKAQFDYRLKEYNRVKTKLSELNTTILTSINSDFLTYFHDPAVTSVYDRLKALKDNVAPNDRGRELTVTAQYEALKKLQKRLGVSTWLNKFRKVCNKARILKLPCVDKDRAAIDFLTTVKVWESIRDTNRMVA